MKKSIICIVALMLLLSFLFVSCGDVVDDKKGTDSESIGVTDEATEEITSAEVTTEAFVDVSPYVVKETLMDSEVSKGVYDLFTAGKGSIKPALAMEAPYVMNDVTKMQNTKLTSMSIPVQKTTRVDEDGNFTLTLFIFDSTFSGLQKEAKRSYKIKINADEYGIKANNSKVKKVIDIDLSSYNITVAKNETVGYFAKDDTLFPGIIGNTLGTTDPMLKIIREDDVILTGCYQKAGTTNIAYKYDTLIVNFEWEREYESKSSYLAMFEDDGYDAMIAELKKKYSGKYLSVIGDSISSYNGYCNDATANTTIGSNAAYYPTYGATVYDASAMYWGKVAKELNMKICVTNTWSGSFAVGKVDGTNMLERAAQLHRDGGTPNNPADDIKPDVIIVYFGINDLNGNKPLEDKQFYSAVVKSPETAIKEWFPSVLKAQQASGSTKLNVGYSTFEQVYALGINKMRELYPDAEIYCLTYQESNHKNTTPDKFKRFNATVKAIANYFGATIVDQSKDIITQVNCHVYAHDDKSLHPNAAGHAVMAENIMRTMYKNLKK